MGLGGKRTADAHAEILIRAGLWEPFEAEVMAGYLKDVLDIRQDVLGRLVGLGLALIRTRR